MEYWAKPRMARDQIVLFSPTLDASISDDHPVRLLDEILKGLDWSAWEAEYDGQKGQPPIPPWVMAGVILYGLMRGIRSSRMLEYLCGHNVDFMWLAEGRVIDHTTLCKFRTRFRGPLKELFRQLGKLSLQMGLIRLVEVAFDGTRVKANASRLRTWTAERLEAALKGDEQGPAWRDDGEPAGVPLCGLCGLALAGECLDPKAKRGRTVQRDEYEPLREKMAAKMQTPQGKSVYNQRMHVAETPFAVIKSILGVRRFLLRGLEKVRTEWLWVCTAYNMRKLLAHVAGLCAELAKMLAEAAS